MVVGWQSLKVFHTHTDSRWKTSSSLLLLVEPHLGIISVILKSETVNTVFSSLFTEDFKHKKTQQHSFLEDKHALLYRYLDQSLIFVVTCSLIEVAICRLVLATFVMCLLLVQICHGYSLQVSNIVLNRISREILVSLTWTFTSKVHTEGDASFVKLLLW